MVRCLYLVRNVCRHTVLASLRAPVHDKALDPQGKHYVHFQARRPIVLYCLMFSIPNAVHSATAVTVGSSHVAVHAMSKSWVRPQQATPLAGGQDQSSRSTGSADALANGQLPRNKLQWTRQQQQQQNSGSHADTSRAIQHIGGLANSIKPVKTGTTAPQNTGSRHRVYVRSSVPAGPETGAAAQPLPSQPQQQEPQQQRRHQQQTQQAEQQQHCQQQQNLAVGPKRIQQAAPPVAKRRQVQQHGVQHAQAALPAGQQQQPQQHQLRASTKPKAVRKQQQQQLLQVAQPQVPSQQHPQQLHQGLALQQAITAAGPAAAAASSTRAAAAVKQPCSAVAAPAAAPAAVAAGASSPAAPKRCSRAAAIAAARASVLRPRRNTRPVAVAAAGRGAARGSVRQAARFSQPPGAEPVAAAAAGKVTKARAGGVGKGKLLRSAQFITAPAQDGSNCQLVYAKARNKLQRTAVKAAVAGTSLKWVNKQTAPHLAEAAAAAVESAALARQQRVQQQQERRQQLMQKAAQQRQPQGAAKRSSSAAAASAGIAARRPLQPVKPLRKGAARGGAGPSATSSGKRGSLRLVRIGDQVFYQSAKGLRALAAVSQQGVAASTSAAAAVAGSGLSTGAACIVQPSPQQKPALRCALSITIQSTVAGRAGARAAAAAAAAARSRRTLAAKRLASRGAAGGRRGRQAGRSGAGLCLYFCRFGACGRQQKGECALVHDPSKVAVCTHWLAGSCSAGDKCKRQHKVVPELMPVCTYYLEGKCSNRDCPYLHIKVAADAPPCKDFLAGYCPKGAACTHKHLTQRMAKQLEQHQQKAQAVVAGAGALAGQDGVAAFAPPPAAAAAAPAQADAATVGEGGVVTEPGQQQQQDDDAGGGLVPAAAVAAENMGGVGSGTAAALQAGWAGEEALTALLPSESEDSEDWE